MGKRERNAHAPFASASPSPQLVVVNVGDRVATGRCLAAVSYCGALLLVRYRCVAFGTALYLPQGPIPTPCTHLQRTLGLGTGSASTCSGRSRTRRTAPPLLRLQHALGCVVWLLLHTLRRLAWLRLCPHRPKKFLSLSASVFSKERQGRLALREHRLGVVGLGLPRKEGCAER